MCEDVDFLNMHQDTIWKLCAPNLNMALHSCSNKLGWFPETSIRQRKCSLNYRFFAVQILSHFFIAFLWFIQNHQASPRSTPNSSPRSTKSPPLPPGAPSSRSAPPTPGGQLQPSMMASLGTGADSLTGVGGDVRSAFGTSSSLIGKLLSSIITWAWYWGTHCLQNVVEKCDTYIKKARNNPSRFM